MTINPIRSSAAPNELEVNRSGKPCIRTMPKIQPPTQPKKPWRVSAGGKHHHATTVYLLQHVIHQMTVLVTVLSKRVQIDFYSLSSMSLCPVAPVSQLSTPGSRMSGPSWGSTHNSETSWVSWSLSTLSNSLIKPSEH